MFNAYKCERRVDTESPPLFYLSLLPYCAVLSHHLTEVASSSKAFEVLSAQVSVSPKILD